MPRYFILYLLCFWGPVLVLTPPLWLATDRPTKKAVAVTLFLFCWPLSFLMEYVYLWADVWDFSTAWDPLLGVRLFNAPVEEFVFWFGAPWIVLYLYLILDKLDRRFLRRSRA